MIAKRQQGIILVSAVFLAALLGCSRHGPYVAAALEFDAKGSLLSATGPDGNKITFHYDARCLPVEVVSPDGPVHYAYDAHGNRIWSRDKTGATEYYYDAFDRLSAVVWDRGPKQFIAYQYDHTGLVSRISVFNLQALQNSPDYSQQIARLGMVGPTDFGAWHERERMVLALADQLLAVPDTTVAPWRVNDLSYIRGIAGDMEEIRSGMGTVRFSRSPDGRGVERILPNGVHSHFEYASDGQLSSLRHVDSFGREIASFIYNYDGTARLQDVSGSEPGGPVKIGYSWDSRGRLQSMTSGGGEFTYRYDTQGRRVAVMRGGAAATFTFDSLGRVVKAKGIALGITPHGTMSVRQDGNESTEIRYNSVGRPLEMTTRSAKFRYSWDGEGNLVSLSRNGKTVHFVPAAGTGIRVPLLEFGEDGKTESNQLVDQSVLGRIGPHGFQFYLEGVLGEAAYTVDEQGRLSNEMQGRAALPLMPLLRQTQAPLRSIHQPTVAGADSAFVRLAQFDPYPPDPSWLSPAQQGAFAQGYAEGSQLAFDYLLYLMQGFHDATDREAELNMQRGGAWGWLGYTQAIASDLLFGLPSDLSRSALAVTTYYTAPNQRTLSAMNQTAFPLISQLADLGTGELAKGVIGAALKPGVTNRWIDQNLKALYKDVQPDLDTLIDNGGLQAKNMGLATAATLIANNSFRSASELGGNIAGWFQDISEGIQHANDLNKANGPAVSGAPKQLGGIQLSSTVQGDIGRISGAVLDRTTGSIVLLSDNSDVAVSGVRAEDFAVALRLAYSESSDEAAFSLDPADPTKPTGPWLQKVYYPAEVLAGTGFGKAMFDADWLLKQYSFGVVAEPGKEQHPRISSVPGYKSVAALALEDQHHGNGPATMARFWIVSCEMRVRRDGLSIVFDRAAMGVKTKRQVRDPGSKTGLRDDETVKDPINDEFAKRFTEHYDELAAESPELERVRGLAKAVAIAKWMRQNNVPVDLNSIVTAVADLKHEDAEAYRLIPSLSTDYSQERKEGIPGGIRILTRSVSLFGGVDLNSNPQFIADPDVAQLGNAVKDRLQHTRDPRFNLTYRGRDWTGTVFPLTREGLQQRANAKSFVRNGFVYKLGEDGRLVEIVDPAGNRASYRNPAAGGKGGIQVIGTGGWTALAQPQHGQTKLQISTARGNVFNLLTNSAGVVQSVDVDGKSWAAYRSTGPTRSVRLNHGYYTEDLSYDSAGRITNVRLERTIAGQVRTESVKAEYSPNGLPVQLSGTGVPEIEWHYDSGGRLQTVTSSDGASINATYDDKSGRATLEHRTGGAGGDFQRRSFRATVFENNRLLSTDSPKSGKVDYTYEDQRLVSVKSERAGEIHFSYDTKGRPASVNLPSGFRVKYRFLDEVKRRCSEAAGFELQVLAPISR